MKNDLGSAGGNSRAGRQPTEELHSFDFFRRALLGFQGGYGTSLDNVEIPLLLGPLDVLRALVQGFYLLGNLGQSSDVLVRQFLKGLVSGWNGYLDVLSLSIPAVRVPYQLPFLSSNLLLQEAQRFFLQKVHVRCQLAGDQGFSQAVGRFDHYLLLVAAQRFCSEGDAGNLRLHHSLHYYGNADL